MGISLLREPNAFQQACRLVDEFQLRMSVQQWRLAMQDAWLLMYLLVDNTQSGQPPNRERYYSPRTANVTDTARRVLSKNPLKYHVISRHFQNQSRDEREPIRHLENVLHGVLYDIDRQLTENGEMTARSQAAFHALVRGAWAYKYHLTKEFRSCTGSPQHYVQLDPRLVLPAFSGGVDSAIAHNITTLSEQLYVYPEKIQPIVDQARDVARESNGTTAKVDYSFLHYPLRILEWSSREEHAVLLDLAGLPDHLTEKMSIRTEEHTDTRYVWLEEPYEHGFERSLIQYGNVNGMPAGLASREAADMARQSPTFQLPVDTDALGAATTGILNRPTLYLADGSTYFPQSSTVDPAGAFAGRAIFANVAHLMPEFNRLTALLKDAIIQEVRGTWTFKSRDGRMQAFDLGTGKINPLTLNEQLEKVNANIQSPDVLALMQMISQEISDGTIDLRFILASDAEGTGFLRARLEQAALISTDDYKEGLQNWGVSVAQSFVTQFRRARKGSFKSWSITGREPGDLTQFFVVDLDDNVEEAIGKQAKEPPVIEATVKVSMPIDQMARINMAKAAIDPSNPIMSLSMALDIIMEFDDADAAYDSILEDVGNRHPTIQLLRIADAFKRSNAPELAQMILQDEFRNAFATASQTHNARTGTPSGASPGIQPGTTPPEITSGGGTEAGNTPSPQMPQGQ